MTVDKIVVLGGEGMLGHKMFQRLRQRWAATFCTVRGDAGASPLPRLIPGAGTRMIGGLNLMDFDRLAVLLRHHRPDWIVNCAGIIKQRADAHAAIPSITINSLLPHRLAALCADWGGRLLHFSTDCVFSGRSGGYTEDHEPDAQDLYGRSKYLGEVHEPNALTVRTSIIGREMFHHKSLLEWFLSQRGGHVRGFTRAIYSGVTTNYLAELVADIIENHSELAGLFHVAAEPISKHDLLCMLRDAYKLDVVITPDSSYDSNKTLIASRFKQATGCCTPAWDALIRQLASDPTPYSRCSN